MILNKSNSNVDLITETADSLNPGIEVKYRVSFILHQSIKEASPEPVQGFQMKPFQ